MNNWTSGGTPGLAGVCEIGVALPITHKLLDYREFVGDSLINSKIARKVFQPTLHFYSISPNICLCYSKIVFLVCGVWVALPLHHKLLDYREFVDMGISCSESLWWMGCAILMPQTLKPYVYPCPTNSWTSGSLWCRGSATHTPQTRKNILSIKNNGSE